MEKNAKIYVTGHSGLVGSALIRALQTDGYTNIVTASHKELDLIDPKAVEAFFEKEKPEFVFHVAARVGGIIGNRTFPADFMYANTMINTNVIYSAHNHKVKKLINFGSICIYPVDAAIPVKEESLLTGPLEYTNEGYAMSKINSLMFAKKFKEQYHDNFISVMPSNIYGINDNFHPTNSHVIPGMMRRFIETKEKGEKQMVVWGTGKPTRDFINSNDVADALIFLMNNYDGLEHINIGPGIETSISELANTIKEIVGFEGELTFDTSKPDGTPKRYLDVSKVNALGWKTKVPLKEGLEEMYKWFMENRENLREV